MPAFSASADFAIDKEAEKACPNLQPDFHCGIHTRLRQRGFPGCAVYDCFGAGQKVSQVTFGGRDWRRNPQSAAQMFEVFPIMRQLHELLWYLAEALTLQPARSLRPELSLTFDETERLSNNPPESLLQLDLDERRRDANALLSCASELVRAKACPRSQDLKGADLIGADLKSSDLRVADLIGADFRGADLSGADLTESIFLTQSQLNASKGDAHTRLPPTLTRPTHWLSTRL